MSITEPSTNIMLAAQIAMAMLMLAALIAFVRIIKGPGRADRIVALDFLTFVVVSLIGALAIYKHDAKYLDVGIVLALVGFLATIAYTRYCERIHFRERYEKNKREDMALPPSKDGNPATSAGIGGGRRA